MGKTFVSVLPFVFKARVSSCFKVKTSFGNKIAVIWIRTPSTGCSKIVFVWNSLEIITTIRQVKSITSPLSFVRQTFICRTTTVPAVIQHLLKKKRILVKLYKISLQGKNEKVHGCWKKHLFCSLEHSISYCCETGHSKRAATLILTGFLWSI